MSKGGIVPFYGNKSQLFSGADMFTGGDPELPNQISAPYENQIWYW